MALLLSRCSLDSLVLFACCVFLFLFLVYFFPCLCFATRGKRTGGRRGLSFDGPSLSCAAPTLSPAYCASFPPCLSLILPCLTGQSLSIFIPARTGLFGVPSQQDRIVLFGLTRSTDQTSAQAYPHTAQASALSMNKRQQTKQED